MDKLELSPSAWAGNVPTQFPRANPQCRLGDPRSPHPKDLTEAACMERDC